MIRPLSLCLVASVFGWGCGDNAGTGSDPASKTNAPLHAEEPMDAEHALFEQVRSGSVQLGGAADDIEDALRAVEDVLANAPKGHNEALEDAKALIDSSGAGIADFTSANPDYAEFKSQIPLFDDFRLKAIQEANDSAQDLREAKGIIQGIEVGANTPLAAKLDDLAELLNVAIADLEEAIQTMGGLVESIE